MHSTSNRRAAWSLGLMAVALAACSDDTPTQPKANLPAAGPTKPSAVVHIIPEGTTFSTKIAYATGFPFGKEAMVKLYDKDGKQITWFLAFGAYEDFSAGVNVAIGDVNGDGWPDIIAGEGPTAWSSAVTSKVSVWDGQTGTRLQTWTPFGSFKGGVRVGAADVDGDGKAEILACTGAGTGGNRALALRLGSTAPVYGSEINLYTNNLPRVGGCHVAGGDLNGDGRAEIVAHFDGKDDALVTTDVKTFATTIAFRPLGWDYSVQADVAVADVNGDKHDDILLSFLRDSAVVRVFDGSKVKPNTPLTQLSEVKPMWDTSGGGIDIATHDLNGDGKLDLLYKQTNPTHLSFWKYSWVFAKAGTAFYQMLFYYEEPGSIAPGGTIG